MQDRSVPAVHPCRDASIQMSLAMIRREPAGSYLFRTMRTVKGFGSGLGGFIRAFGFMLNHGMGWMFLAPILLWVLLAYGLFMALQGPVDALSVWLGGQFALSVEQVEGDGMDAAWNSFKAFLNGAREFLTLIVLKVAVAYILYTVNKYLVLVLLSPLLANASERTEEVLTGESFPFSWPRLLKDAWRGSLIAMRNGFLELLINVGLWFLTLMFPISVPFTVIFLFLVSAYFYGFSMFDYMFERRRLRLRDSVQAVNRNIGAVIANGMCFSLLMKVPLLGMMLAPPMAAVGAVIALRDELTTRPQHAVERSS